jgi:type VI secretion system protein ImpI
MILTLEVCGPEAASLGAAGRKVFDGTGGLIGRLPDNDWVLPGEYVSGHHARIQFRNGQFLVEDTSTNGVSVNSPDNRLQRGRAYPIKSGDRLFIDTYEISVTVAAGERGRDPFVPAQIGGSGRNSPFIPEDPFSVDAVEAAPAPRGGARAGGRGPLGDAGDPFGGLMDPIAGTGEADPLKVLGIENKRAPAPRAPRASDLASGSPLSDPYRPPVVRIPEVVEPLTPEPMVPEDPLGESLIPQGLAPQQGVIPPDYDPLAPETSGFASPAQPPVRPSPRKPEAPPRVVAPPPAMPRRPSPGPGAARAPRPAGVTPADQRAPVRAAPAPPAPVWPVAPAPRPSETPPRPNSPDPMAGTVASQGPGRPQVPERTGAAARLTGTAASSGGDFDFAAFLQGAGVQGVEVSPELAREFGEVLRVVIAGLMETLRARERIKGEFRLRATTFKPADNNPLKFSANLEDALHNLLLKRNPAYLGPVEAFEDAFRDVRSHQMAMLAGVRVAYEAMLAQFDPERLQAEFDRQLKKGGRLGAPARLKYWELYRERFRDRVRDADSCFRNLFGDEFAKAYEEQLERLRALPRATDK